MAWKCVESRREMEKCLCYNILMNTETKTCQNCKHNFQIFPEDFAFYEKINVPAPTFCPECRLVRRMLVSNEVRLYKRTCDLTGKNIMTIYPPEVSFPVYDYDVWNTDEWDPRDYAMDVDFSRPFLEQVLELKQKVPKPSLVKQGLFVNSEYTNRISDAKNCYMVFRATNNEEVMYTYIAYNSRECIDCVDIFKSELCYQTISSVQCSRVHYSQDVKDCRDSYFLFGCSNCSDCFGCVNLRNKQYCIWNEQYTKEEYEEKILAMQLDRRENLEKYEREFNAFKKDFPHRYMSGTHNNNVTGNGLVHCNNLQESFFCKNTEEGKYLFNILDSKDCMDYFHWGMSSELMYEVANAGINCSRVSFSHDSWKSATNIEYCDNSISAQNCFGCVGLKNGEYSILNKRYEPEEYKVLVEKIKQHMNDMPYVDARGIVYRYGEFFPAEMSPFTYNETAAQEFFPLTKEQALERGYSWKDIQKNTYTTTIQASSLPQTITEVDETIHQQVIADDVANHSASRGAYIITPQEFAFYRKMNIPLPTKSFDVRHAERMSKLLPLKLYKRTTEDGVQVMTPYAPDRPEKIYSEKGYQDLIM